MSYSGQNQNLKIQPIPGLQQQLLDAQLSSSAFNLPLAFKAGIACDLMSELFDMYESSCDLGISQSREHRWLIGGDFETLADVSEQFSLGTEYTYNDLLSIRGGYRFGQDQFNLAGGVGIHYVGGGFDGTLDYSIQPTRTLGVVNRITLGLRLN